MQDMTFIISADRAAAEIWETLGAVGFTDVAVSLKSSDPGEDPAEVTATNGDITVDAGERPYQGIVEMAPSSLADSLENYFARSVQVPSHVALVSNESLSGGILLQQMPGQHGLDEDDWHRLGYMAATARTK